MRKRERGKRFSHHLWLVPLATERRQWKVAFNSPERDPWAVVAISPSHEMAHGIDEGTHQ